ncbi:MAG: hypothetical protein P8Y97_06030, partial [Candidatus Lokiarchaeota archaeon]
MVYYEIKDNAGRVSQYVDSIGLDTVDPFGSIEINNNDNWTISSSVILTLSYDDITSGVDKVRYSNDGITWNSWEAASSTKAWILSIGDSPSKMVYYEIKDNNSWEAASSTKAWILSIGDGPSKMVYYEIKDNAGRVSQYVDSIGLDTNDPSGNILINNDDTWTTSIEIILNLTYFDSSSGIDQVRYSNDGSSWTSWEDPITTRLWILSNGDGPSKTVYYEIKDNAGRISQFIDTIGLDTASPTGSIQINGDDAFTNVTNVLLSLTYNDMPSGVDKVRYSNDGISWTSWEDPGDNRAWSLASGDGLKIVFYEIRDKAGLVFQINDSISLDTTGPSGSIIINDNNAWTTSNNVILTLSYNDASGVDEVRYSNDGSSWTSWEDPVIMRSWSLNPGDGIKTVYYEIKNNAGLIIQVTDSIGLDTILPS